MYHSTAERIPRSFAPEPSGPPIAHAPLAGDGCLTGFLTGISDHLAADGLLVACHVPAKMPILMFSDGECCRDSAIEQLVLDCATRSLAEGDVGAADAPSGRDRLTSTLATATLKLGDVAITLTSLLKEKSSAARGGPRERLARILPIAWPFLRMWAQRQRLDRKLEGLEAALDRTEIATLLLDASGRVQFANRSGRALLDAGRGLSAEDRMLVGPSLAETLRVRAALAHVCSGGRTDRSVTPIIAVPRRKRRPLMVTLEAVDSLHDTDIAGTVIAHLFDPEDDLTDLIAPVCRFYGLSPSETRLTRAIAEGQPLAGAAAATGVREQTARSYLKQIFLKTETNRQAELVALMLRSAVRLAPKSRTQVF